MGLQGLVSAILFSVRKKRKVTKQTNKQKTSFHVVFSLSFMLGAKRLQNANKETLVYSLGLFQATSCK